MSADGVLSAVRLIFSKKSAAILFVLFAVLLIEGVVGGVLGHAAA